MRQAVFSSFHRPGTVAQQARIVGVEFKPPGGCEGSDSADQLRGAVQPQKQGGIHGTRRRKGSETDHLADLSRSVRHRITRPLRGVPCPRRRRGMVMDHRIWPSSTRGSSARSVGAPTRNLCTSRTGAVEKLLPLIRPSGTARQSSSSPCPAKRGEGGRRPGEGLDLCRDSPLAGEATMRAGAPYLLA